MHGLSYSQINVHPLMLSHHSPLEHLPIVDISLLPLVDKLEGLTQLVSRDLRYVFCCSCLSCLMYARNFICIFKQYIFYIFICIYITFNIIILIFMQTRLDLSFNKIDEASEKITRYLASHKCQLKELFLNGI